MNIKKFNFKEVIINIKEGEVWENSNKEIRTNIHGDIFIEGKRGNNLITVIEKEDLFTLQYKEVPVLEAMEAFDKEGKTIYCVYKGYKEDKEYIETYIPEEDNSLGENDLTPYMIINGKWYIKD